MSISAFNFHLMIAWDFLQAAESAMRMHRYNGRGTEPMALLSAKRWTKAARRNLRMAAQAARQERKAR